MASLQDLLKTVEDEDVVDYCLELDNTPKRIIRDFIILCKATRGVDRDRLNEVKRIQSAKLEYRKLLKAMRSYPVDQVDQDNLLVLTSYLQDGIEEEEVILYKVEDINTFQEDQRVEAILADSWEDYKMDQVQSILDITAKLLPTGYAYEFHPWNEIIRYQVYDVPSYKDRVKLVALVLEEITFFGFNQSIKDTQWQVISDCAQKFHEDPELHITQGTLWEKEDKPYEEYMSSLYRREALYNQIKAYELCKILKGDLEYHE